MGLFGKKIINTAPNHFGLDISDLSLKAVEIHATGKEQKVVGIQSVPLSQGSVVDGSIMKVEEFRGKMISLGVLVRDASNFNYLDNRYFRLAIKDRKNNKKVLRCVEDAIR